VLLLVFGNISQINPNSVPRHLRIVSIDTTGLAEALSASSGAALSNFTDIYNANTPYFTKTSGDIRHDGLRKTYEWGLWSKFKAATSLERISELFLTHPSCRCPGYCSSNGAVGEDRSYCEDASIYPAFQPAKILLDDIPVDYSNQLKETLPENVFSADDYLRKFTRIASYLILVGSLSTALAAIFALFARRVSLHSHQPRAITARLF